MVPRIIEYCVRNRFIVLLMIGVLAMSSTARISSPEKSNIERK